VHNPNLHSCGQPNFVGDVSLNCIETMALLDLGLIIFASFFNLI
jgi:hypothetical protein